MFGKPYSLVDDGSEGFLLLGWVIWRSTEKSILTARTALEAFNITSLGAKFCHSCVGWKLKTPLFHPGERRSLRGRCVQHFLPSQIIERGGYFSFLLAGNNTGLFHLAPVSCDYYGKHGLVRNKDGPLVEIWLGIHKSRTPLVITIDILIGPHFFFKSNDQLDL